MKIRLRFAFASLFALCFPLFAAAPSFAAPETPIIPYCQHVWGKATYTWSEDYSTCTVTRTCVRNKNHTISETAAATLSEETSADCDTPASKTYTASFKNEAFETGTATVVTSQALGHDWNETKYVWENDYSACTATRTCNRNESHVLEETAPASAVMTKPVTAEEDGTVTYTAVFSNRDLPAATLDVPISYLDVLWGDANGDGVVNNKDIVRLKNYLADYDEESKTSTVDIFPGADASGDGAVNNKDIVRLKNYFANLEDGSGLFTVTLGPAA